MKIDFIISSLGGGGAERVMTLMAEHLSKDPKNDISVITFLKGNDNYQLNGPIKHVELNGLSFIPSHTVRSVINLTKYYRTKSNRPDVAISFITLTNFIAILGCKLNGVKIIAQEHNSHLRFMKGRKFISSITKKFVYRKADVLTVLTSFDVPYYKKYGVNTYVMPNPCSFKPIDTNNHEREKTILAIGNLNRYFHKGFDNLINLIKPILDNHPEWVLKIAGGGKEESFDLIKKLVKQNNLENNVIFTGFITNVSEVMHKSSIFILPSRFEGLPMVLLEAMSQGMACIAYDCKTGPSDIINHNENGLLIEDQNAQKMQANLEKLIIDKNLRSKLAEEGIKSLDKYHIDAITERYKYLFNKLIG